MKRSQKLTLTLVQIKGRPSRSLRRRPAAPATIGCWSWTTLRRTFLHQARRFNDSSIVPQNAFVGLAHGSKLGGFKNDDHGGEDSNESDLRVALCRRDFGRES